MNDNHYALVVGINRYPGIGDLHGPRADAESFAAWLADPDGGGLPPTQIKRVFASAADEGADATPQTARPTNLEIDYALQELVKTIKERLAADPASWEDSRLYFYAAGHGFAPQGGEAALFMANAELDALNRNIDVHKYRVWCLGCALVKEIVVFADCCRTRIRTAIVGYAPTLNECPAPWNGKASICVTGFGSTFGSPTYEIVADAGGGDDATRGYFTAALLEGLRGGAPRDEAGALTASNLSGYVKTLVAERTKTQQFPQEVEINGPMGTTISFGTNLPPPRRHITINFPAGYVGQATLVKDGRPLQTWDDSQPWELELADGLYEVDGDGFDHDSLFKVAGEDRNVQL